MAAYYYTRAAMPHDQKQKAKTIADAYQSGCNGLTYRLQKCSAQALPATKLPISPARGGTYRLLHLYYINPTRHSLTATFLSAAKPLIFFLRQSRFFFSHGGKAARPAPSVGNHHHSFAELLLITTGHCKRLSIRLQWPDLPAARYGQGRTPICPAAMV